MNLTTEKIGGKTIDHITLSVDALTATQSLILCQEPTCEKTFTLPQNYQVHLVQCHQRQKYKAKPKKENHEERYHCPIENCRYNISIQSNGKHFSNRKSLKQHYLKVHADKCIKCDSCEAKFSAHSYLKAHQISCGKDLSCSCGAYFSSLPALQTHVRRTQHQSEWTSKTSFVDVQKATRDDPSKSSRRYKSIQPRVSSPTCCSNQPKSHQSHIVAAIALSELGVARIKRISTVDVGIQTESVQKRVARRSSAASSKRKQTTEMETQTHLTNLEKKKKARRTRTISTSSHTMTPRTEQNQDPYWDPQYQTTTIDTESFSLLSSCNSASTQTHLGTSNAGIQITDLSNIYGSSIDTIDKTSNNLQDNNYESSQILLDDDNFASLGRSGSRNPSLSQVRSSSMETQTDVLLNSQDCLFDEQANLWCSSETQTYENFSDIEQYLCSTTHTQTHDNNELFPELNFSHSQTQTSLEESPSLVDTQTQTLYGWSL